MVRVVQHNSKQVRCQGCASLLEYTPYDINVQELWWMSPPDKQTSITCPVCGTIVKVENQEKEFPDDLL